MREREKEKESQRETVKSNNSCNPFMLWLQNLAC